MKGKLLSVIIPCYNSQDYMDTCIKSLLDAGDAGMELILIDDGSSDGTAEIADNYASRHPESIRVIHQENKGHGGAVNTGISAATGLYLKVVDSDDWVDLESLKAVLFKLRELSESSTPVDMFVSNFVYEKDGARLKKTVRYHKVLPQGRVFGWSDVKPFRKGQYMLMHSLIYRTSLLHQCQFKLPLHTYYVDNLFAFTPLNHVQSIYYLDVNLYRYYIGRDDQSVNEQVMIRRIDQQLKVNQLMIDHMLKSCFDNQRLKRYMRHYLEIIMTISSILLIRSQQKDSLEEKKNLWHSVKHRDKSLYYRLRFGLLGMITNLPGKLGRKISIGIYVLSQKAVGFN